MRDGAPLTARVGSLAVRALVSCTREATIAEAARRMADSDLRRHVVAARVDSATSVEAVMTQPAITIRHDELGLQAIETMLARRIHHLVVVDDLAEARRSCRLAPGRRHESTLVPA